MCSNIPASPAYGVCISQLIRYAIILISWNVIFICETGYWARSIKRFALFDLLKSLCSDIPIPRSCRNIFRLCRDDNKRCIFI
jgi:hypothetical protein